MARRLTPRRSPVAAIAALAWLLAPAAAQEPTPAPEPPPRWPSLSEADAETARVAGLRKLDAADAEVAAAAEKTLIDLGAAVAPLCLDELRRNRLTPNGEAALHRVLDAVVAPAHLPLIAAVAGDARDPVRRFATRWLARQHDERTREVLTARLAAREKDPAVRFSAALGLFALGDAASLDAVLPAIAADWPGHADEVRATLSPARSEALATQVADRVAGADELELVAGLRMLRYLAPKDFAPRIAVHLNASQHAVKKAAINALRVSVDGDEPLEKLSVFQSIDAARKWQERIR